MPYMERHCYLVGVHQSEPIREDWERECMSSVQHPIS